MYYAVFFAWFVVLTNKKMSWFIFGKKIELENKIELKKIELEKINEKIELEMTKAKSNPRTTYYRNKKVARKAVGKYTSNAARSLRSGKLSVADAVKKRGLARSTAKRLKKSNKRSFAEKRALLCRGIDQALTKLHQQRRSYKNDRKQQPKKLISAKEIRAKMMTTPAACGLPKDFKVPSQRQVERAMARLLITKSARKRNSEKMANKEIDEEQWRSLCRAQRFA